MRNVKVLTLLTVIGITALFCVGVTYRYNSVLTNEDFIRLHVVANSDSPEDQALKLKVRDSVTEMLDEKLIHEAMRKSDGTDGQASLDIEESRLLIENSMSEIVEKAEEVIAAEGYDYNVSAEFGVTWIPEKTYGNVTFPAGNYEALKLLIGEAAGHNWWCVLYPPLCLIDSDSSTENDYILRDMVMTGKYEKLSKAAKPDAPATTLQLKFKSIDIAKKIVS